MSKDQMSNQTPIGWSGYPATVPSYDEATRYPNIPQPMQQTIIQPPPIIEQTIVRPIQIQPVVQNPPVGPNPTILVCPSCREHIQTNVETVASTKTHLVAVLLCILQCYPCICCPYCIGGCQNRNHTCPICGAFIGTYSS